MKKTTIGGIEFTNFGDNSYTHGMELITATNPPRDIVERVLKGEFENVWLNPSAECTRSEFYGLLGSREQYEKVYQEQSEAQISKMVAHLLGGFDALRKASKKEFDEAHAKAESEYTPWWECSYDVRFDDGERIGNYKTLKEAYEVRSDLNWRFFSRSIHIYRVPKCSCYHTITKIV